MGEEGGLRERKESCGGIWGKDEYWSKKAREVEYDEGKRL